jgi:hypothetical protein
MDRNALREMKALSGIKTNRPSLREGYGEIPGDVIDKMVKLLAKPPTGAILSRSTNEMWMRDAFRWGSGQAEYNVHGLTLRISFDAQGKKIEITPSSTNLDPDHAEKYGQAMIELAQTAKRLRALL